MANQDDRDLGFFDQDKVVALMSELAEVMAADGIGAKIVIVGGGALCFVYDRQATTDVDAAIHPKETVARYAAEIARRQGLHPDWLKDKAVGFFPQDDPGHRSLDRRRQRNRGTSGHRCAAGHETSRLPAP